MPRILLLLAVLCLVPASATVAQGARIAGTVHDSAGRPLPNVTLRVVDLREQVLTVIQSGDDGTYGAAVPRNDTIRVLVRRLGYAPYASTPLVVGAVTRHDVVLIPFPQQLAGIVVRAVTNRQAFLERSMSGIPHAYFADSAMLAGKDKRSVPILLEQLEGFGIHPGTSQSNPAAPPALVGPRSCGVLVYVDGWVLKGGIDKAVRAREISAVEVYAAPELAPIPYRQHVIGRPCPMVLIWTVGGMSWEPRTW